MAFSLTNQRVASQCGYQDTRSSFQGKSHFGQTPSSFCDGDAMVVRNYNNVHDLTWNFQEFFSENEQVGAPPAFKRRRSSIIENPSATNYRLPFCSGDFDRTERSWSDINSNSTTTLLRHTANPYNAPSTSSSFVFQTRADDRLGAFCGYSYEPRSYSDNVSTSDNSRESSQGFMSREELERCSPSRKDGIDLHRETYLRYSYCAFLQNLGMQLGLPQTSIGTAIVLCHRFFVRRSHACHDRFLIATASLFLAAKSEETPRPLNTVLKAAFEIHHEHNFPFSSRANWFEEYKEQVLDAEHIILTTLDFELGVQHPYVPLTSVLNKLGIRQSVLVNLAWNLINEGLFGVFDTFVRPGVTSLMRPHFPCFHMHDGMHSDQMISFSIFEYIPKPTLLWHLECLMLYIFSVYGASVKNCEYCTLANIQSCLLHCKTVKYLSNMCSLGLGMHYEIPKGINLCP